MSSHCASLDYCTVRVCCFTCIWIWFLSCQVVHPAVAASAGGRLLGHTLLWLSLYVTLSLSLSPSLLLVTLTLTWYTQFDFLLIQSGCKVATSLSANACPTKNRINSTLVPLFAPLSCLELCWGIEMKIYTTQIYTAFSCYLSQFFSFNCSTVTQVTVTDYGNAIKPHAMCISSCVYFLHSNENQLQHWLLLSLPLFLFVPSFLLYYWYLIVTRTLCVDAIGMSIAIESTKGYLCHLIQLTSQ